MNQSIKSLCQKQSNVPKLASSTTPQNSVTLFTSDDPLSKIINEHSLPIKTPLSFKPPSNNHLLLFPTLPIPIPIQKSFSISKSKKQCILCDKRMTKAGDLKAHFFQIHPQNWKYTPFRCQEPGCGKGFVKPTEYSRHESSVAHSKTIGVKSILPCPWPGCFKQIRGSKQALKVHMYTHNKQWPFWCPFEGCKKGYPNKTKLKDHIRSHTGEKPYKCDFCGFCSSVKKSLTRHLKFIHKEVLMGSERLQTI